MPTFDVTSPDGKKYRVTAPEGATQEQIIAYAQAQTAPQEPQPDAFAQTAKDDGFLRNVPAAAGGVVAGIPLGIRQMLGKDNPGEVDEWKRSMEGLWSTPGGKVGTVLGGVGVAAPAMFVPGANTALGAAAVGAGMGAVQPVGDGESRALNTVIGGATGGLAQAGVNKLGTVLANRATAKSAELAAEKAQNAVRDATIQEARQAGYVIPPTQVAPNRAGTLNRLAEGLSGKIQTAQAAAIKNQTVTDALAKKALGLPEDVPLSMESLKAVRSAAGEVYKVVKAAGTMQADDDFARAMSGVTGEYSALVNDFPSQSNGQINSLIQDLSKPTFQSSSMVELVKRLRSDGFQNLRAMEPEKKALGRIQLGAQNALEDLMERNMEQVGAGELAQVFRNARQLIAKTHTVENALEASTSKVVASKIGREFSKGRPLTGELATIGKFAEAFPKAAQNVNSSMPGLSPLDAAAGIMGSMATGSIAGAALPLARPLTRAALLSNTWQKSLAKTPDYSISELERLLPKLLKKPAVGLLGASQVPTLFGGP
jgi:hypothetical protein